MQMSKSVGLQSDMSFYHILLSSAAKNRFPHNQAAKFSIPVDDVQQLNGQWEVAIAQLAYSNCLYTFDHEMMTIEEKCTSAYQCRSGCRVYIPPSTTKDRTRVNNFIINFLNEACKNIMNITMNGEYFIVKINPGWIICLSPKLRYETGFFGNALTSYDRYKGNYFIRRNNFEYKEKELYVDIVPEATLMKKIVIKSKNSDMTIDTLIKKFNFHLELNGEKVATLHFEKSGHFTIKKLKNDDIVLVCSEAFHKYINHHTAAIHGEYKSRFLHYQQANQFTEEWSVSLYRKNIEPVGSGYSIRTIQLTPHIMRSIKDVVEYLNDAIYDSRIYFTSHENILSLTVSGKDIKLSMDDTLRDILGFDQNEFKSGNDTRASTTVSLTRRINYFQIYSNIGVNVRVGDTEAPLLTMIPYNPKDCSILSERHFKKLHYINLKSNYIPQIDISIYDDAGMLIPFHKDAITTLTLHFRQKT